MELEVGDRSVRVTNPDRAAGSAPSGDLHPGMDDSAYSLDTLLEWAERDRLG